ncbi:MAG TPA: hypothetical protein PKX92_01865 [Edaphocola sp.]|nr:hypothetical protein [Edaphocola sp.]
MSAKIDIQKIQIGDQFHLFLEAKGPEKQLHIQWPTLPEIKGVEVMDTGSLDSALIGKQIIYKQKYTLTSFDSGNFSIPPIEFINAKTDSLFTDSIPFQVTTLAVDTSAPFKPIKEIIEVKKNWWAFWPYYLVGTILLFSISYLIFRFIKRRKNKKHLQSQNPESPMDKAIRLLGMLKEQGIEESIEGQKHYYSELTHILREFIEKVLHVSVSEMTTEELLKAAKKNVKLKGVRPELKHIFQTADLAKFAKAQPVTTESDHCWKEAVYIIKKINKEQQEDSSQQ